MAEKRREERSNIMRLAELLADEDRLQEVGSRLVRTQLESMVSQRLGGIGPIAWTDAWVDNGNWGTDVWENAWDSDSWEDKLGSHMRPVARPRGPDEFIELKADEVAAEEVFSAEEVQVLKQLEILGK
jgi:hypothetical protein